MNIRNIETFLRVVELKSFTRAAEVLDYAQSTVTAQIKHLEQELGFPLFDRVGKQITLTTLGEKFASYANQMLHIWFESSVLGKNIEDMSGVLRIGVLESLLFSVLPQVMPIYRQKYKNVEVHLTMGEGADLLALLNKNQLDLIYETGYSNLEPGLICPYQRSERFIFLADPNHEMAKKKNISLNEILGCNMITTERFGYIYLRLSELASKTGIQIRQPIRVNSTVASAEFSSLGLGICLLPEYSVDRFIKQGKVVKLDVDMEPQGYFSRILYHKDKWLAPFVEGFIDIIRAVRPEDSE